MSPSTTPLSLSPSAAAPAQLAPTTSSSSPPSLSPSVRPQTRKMTASFVLDTKVPIPPSLQKSAFITNESSPFRKRSVDTADTTPFAPGAWRGVGAGAAASVETTEQHLTTSPMGQKIVRLDSGWSEGRGIEGESDISEDEGGEDGELDVPRPAGIGGPRRHHAGADKEAKQGSPTSDRPQDYLPTLMMPLSLTHPHNAEPVTAGTLSTTSSGFSTHSTMSYISSSSSSSASLSPRPPTIPLASTNHLDLPITPPAVFLPSPSSDASFSTAPSSPPRTDLVVGIEPSPPLSIVMPSPGSLSEPRLMHVDTPALPSGAAEQEEGAGREPSPVENEQGYFDVAVVAERS